MGMDNIFYLKSTNQRYTVWSLPRSAAYVDYHVELHNPFSDQKMLLPHGQNEQKGNLCIICIRAQLAQDGMVL